MSQYIIAIDQGTSSCRSVLVDMNGKIVDITQKEFTQIFPKSAWVEHDANEIWQTQMEVFEQLMDRNSVSPDQVLGIGITNQRETTVVWDAETSEPIHNAIVWQDRRTASICEGIKKSGLDKYIYENTGLVVDAYFSGTKIKWLLENVDGAMEKAKAGKLRFGTIDSWLIWKMTGGKSHLTDYTNASRTLIYNIRKKEWDEKILAALDIPPSMLPKVKSSASDFGQFEYKGTAIPICGVAGDQQSALFGQACFSKGMTKNTYGTGCFLLMNIGDEFIQSQNGLLTTLCCNKEGEVCYGLEGSVFVAGAAMQWLRDGLKLIKESAESEAIAKELAEDNDVFVVPAFTGLGAPYWNMYARGSVFGLTRGTTDKHLVKATLDSLAYQSHDVIKAMEEDAGFKTSSLNVDGGASANNYLMQFQADLIEAQVERPKEIESTALGAAYLAGMHLGIWNADKIIDNRKVDQKFQPSMDKEKRNSLIKTWKKAVERSMDWIEE